MFDNYMVLLQFQYRPSRELDQDTWQESHNPTCQPTNIYKKILLSCLTGRPNDRYITCKDVQGKGEALSVICLKEPGE